LGLETSRLEPPAAASGPALAVWSSLCVGLRYGSTWGAGDPKRGVRGGGGSIRGAGET